MQDKTVFWRCSDNEPIMWPPASKIYGSCREYGGSVHNKMAFGRSLSMAALISEGILAPGEKLLTFDYMVR